MKLLSRQKSFLRGNQKKYDSQTFIEKISYVLTDCYSFSVDYAILLHLYQLCVRFVTCYLPSESKTAVIKVSNNKEGECSFGYNFQNT